MKALKSLGMQKILPAKGSKKNTKKGLKKNKGIPVQTENEESVMDDDGDDDWEDEDKGKDDDYYVSQETPDADPDYEPRVSECNCHKNMPPGPDDEHVVRIAENLGAAPSHLCELTIASKWLYIPFPVRILWEWLRLNNVTSI
ncbi:hypothetical protein MPER_14825, partial [Moniliophthora perniciosa FA553]